MEVYYFIQKKGIKQGPFKLEELKQQTIYFDDLLWRSDSDNWKRASEFEELQNNFIVKPPLTPKEKAVAQINRTFINTVIKEIALYYVIVSLAIGLLSTYMARYSWEDYKNGRGQSNRYSSYLEGSNNESLYGDNENFWFRSVRAIFSTTHLTKDEQENSGSLLMNLLLSSFASFSFIFVLIGLIYYASKRAPIERDL